MITKAPLPLNLQPPLKGKLIALRPLKASDFEKLYAVASDPLIWEQHPAPNRYQREVYEKLFQEYIESKATLVITDLESQKIIGSSRYYDYFPEKSSIAIGFTMLARKYWGGLYNRELKTLMLQHAFQSVEQVIFHVGEKNIRSQRALEKIGAIQFDQSLRTWPDGRENISIHYQILVDSVLTSI